MVGAFTVPAGALSSCRTDWGRSSDGRYEEAILEPGAELSYQLDDATEPGERRRLLIYPIDERGNPVGNTPAILGLTDPGIFAPRKPVLYWPRGYVFGQETYPNGYPTYDEDGFWWSGLSEGVWRNISNIDSRRRVHPYVTTNISFKREDDGWSIPVSPEHRTYYPNPNYPGTSDWTIVTIHLNAL